MVEQVLSELCTLIADCEHKTAPAALPTQEYAFLVGTPILRDGQIDLKRAKRIDRSTYEEWTRRGQPRSGDVILAREAPVGGVGFVAPGARLALGQRTVLLRPDPTKVDPRYLKFRLAAPEAQDWMQQRASGSTVPHLNVQDVRQLPLGNLPSLPEQEAVSAVLGALEDKTDANARVSSRSAGLAAALLQTASRGAASMPLGEAAELRKGLSYKGAGLADSGMPMVNLANAAAFGGFKRTGWKYYTSDYKARHVTRGGDLLVANTEQTWRNEILGWPMLVPDDVDEALFSHHVSIIDFHPEWAHLRLATWAYLFTTEARQRVEAMAHGTTVAALPAEALTGLSVPVLENADPALAEAEALLARGWAAERESEKLVQLRDALLPALMSGRLRVSEAVELVGEAV